MIRLQEWIHALEEGEGTRVVRVALALLALLALTTLYDLREYRNFSSVEAMDAAQLARNIAEGKGYTTLFVRPLSLSLVEQRQMNLNQRTNDFALLKSPHPDLANPPVYPFVLAALMKALPFDYQIARQNILRVTGSFRYQPEVMVCFFNQALFYIAIGLVFGLARRLFDPGVAWISALLMVGSDMFWRFSVSGLSTLLILVIFLALVWCLVWMEQASGETDRGGLRFAAMASLTGGLVGLGALTRYSFGWLILPVLAFFALYFSHRRAALCLVAFLAFAAVLTPWLSRNYGWSGTMFGTAGYAVMEDTVPFPSDQLERSLAPDLSGVTLGDYRRKLLVNLGGLFQNELPKIGGSWIAAFFFAGLLVRFADKTLGRMRIFALISLAVLTVVQALGRTNLSAGSPEINSENLLVMLAPLIFIYGAGMYSLLLDQLNLPLPQGRQLVTGLFVALNCTPLVFTLLPPREYPLAFPPYVPPWIQQFGHWMEEKELVMSDMPWAMAWYGRRQCIWTTLKVQDGRGRDDFFAINDLRKPVHAIFLTTLSLDARFHTEMLTAEEGTWERFLLDSLATTNGLPARFPLRHIPTGQYLGRGQFFLTDWLRWGKGDLDKTR
jgi:hypothetical protein